MYTIAIHGGAGGLPAAGLSVAQERDYLRGLEDALGAGVAILSRGGASLDAVTAAVRALEDNPLFNAGRGAALTRDGSVELDASIMEGRGLRAGAVACVRHVRSPIELARRVMEKSRHVLLVGEGAEEFALEQELPLVPNSYFRTEERRQQLARALAGEQTSELSPDARGTVGAVALDSHGDLAAATSTGGMTLKRRGRVGDSPIIGAGTYAKNGVCAVSATGHGEYFLRAVAAFHICAAVESGRLTLDAAVSEVLRQRIAPLGGDGGIIAVGAEGQIAMDFTSGGMFRACTSDRGATRIAIYPDQRVQ